MHASSNDTNIHCNFHTNATENHQPTLEKYPKPNQPDKLLTLFTRIQEFCLVMIRKMKTFASNLQLFLMMLSQRAVQRLDCEIVSKTKIATNQVHTYRTDKEMM